MYLGTLNKGSVRPINEDVVSIKSYMAAESIKY